MATRDGGSVVVVGLGNIGSQLVQLLARMPVVHKVTLIDHDSYDGSNLFSQNISRTDIGKPKVATVARWLRRLNPNLEVVARPEAVEAVPRGLLRADLILAAVDSKSARLAVNRIAWRLGVRWIDSGVEPTRLLARVTSYVPGCFMAPCMECAMSEDDYATMEQTLPCGKESAPSTRAPAYLGALAASLQAAECEKVLRGQLHTLPAGREVVVSAGHHTHLVTSYRWNPHCRFDHALWDIQRLRCSPGRLSLRRALALNLGNGTPASGWLRVEGHRFVMRHSCTVCGRTAVDLGLSGRVVAPTCMRCAGRPMVVQGFYTCDRIEAAAGEQMPRRTLRSLGFRRGDVFSVAAGEREHHYEIVGQ